MEAETSAVEAEVCRDVSEEKSQRSSTQTSCRVMSSGRCSALERVGRREMKCDCPRGIFEITTSPSDRTSQEKCLDCDHLLSLHESITYDRGSEPSMIKLLSLAFNSLLMDVFDLSSLGALSFFKPTGVPTVGYY